MSIGSRIMTAGVTAGVLLLAGCTGTVNDSVGTVTAPSERTPKPPGESPSPSSGPSPSTAADQTPDAARATTGPEGETPERITREEWLEGIAEMSDLEDPPEVDMVREVGEDEAGRVLAQCLTDAGFPSSEVGDGVRTDLEGEQEEAYELALYVCTAQYPPPMRYLQPLGDEQLRILYDYQSSEVVDCLVAAGFDRPTVPTLEVFIADFRANRPWNPVLEADPERTSGCEEWPENDVLWP